MNSEFYLGYGAKAPVGLATLMRRVVTGLGMLGLLIGVLLVIGQRPFPSSLFEYGVYRDYKGSILEWPYPMLFTANGSFLLVNEGKHGASVALRGMNGKNVSLRGSLIRRGPDSMLEILPSSVRTAEGAVAGAHIPVADLGQVELTGEIVDGKCFLGVMNPGNGKVHRDCAVRCISGGIPPALLVNDARGEGRILLLVGSDGRQLNREVIDIAGEPLKVSGRLVRTGSTMVLKAEPKDFHRE